MVDCHRRSILLITFAPWIAYRRFLMKAQCVICCGPIQMIVVDGALVRVVQDILLARISQKPSITLMD